MRKTWRLQGILKSYLIIRKADLQTDEKIEMESVVLSAEIDRWFSDPFSRKSLLDIYSVVTGYGTSGISNARLNDLRRRLKPRLELAFRRKEVVALPLIRTLKVIFPDTVAALEAPATPSRVIRPSSLKTSWVEIELVDEEGNPVPGEKYCIALPDGSKREGVLDANGFALVEGLDPGTCKISFPNLDTAAWERC